MSKLNEILENNKKVISFVMMLALLVLMVFIFFYLQKNIEWVKTNPCDYCLNKTKITCFYSDSVFNKNYETINLTFGDIREGQQGNYSFLSSVSTGTSDTS